MEAIDLEDLPVLTGFVQVRRDGGSRVLHVSGEIDSLVVQEHLENEGALLGPVDAIDAGAVTFLSTSGALFLARCQHRSRAAGRAGRLVRPSPVVRRVVALLGFNAQVFATPAPQPDDGQPAP